MPSYSSCNIKPYFPFPRIKISKGVKSPLDSSPAFGDIFLYYTTLYNRTFFHFLSSYCPQMNVAPVGRYLLQRASPVLWHFSIMRQPGLLRCYP